MTSQPSQIPLPPPQIPPLSQIPPLPIPPILQIPPPLQFSPTLISAAATTDFVDTDSTAFAVYSAAATADDVTAADFAAAAISASFAVASYASTIDTSDSNSTAAAGDSIEGGGDRGIIARIYHSHRCPNLRLGEHPALLAGSFF